MKYMLLILTFISLMLVGCEQKVVKVYVDSNGTEIRSVKELPRVSLKKYYVCNEDNGLVYIANTTSDGYVVYTPLLWEGAYLHQRKCSDLEK